MKNRKKTFILIEAALAVLAACFGFMLLWGTAGKPSDKVSVIMQDSDDSQWAAFKYGLRMAAMDADIELSVVNTSGTLLAGDEKTLIENEIENGASAVIVQPVPGNDSEDMLKNIEAKVPVILIESSAGDTGVLPVVQPDNYGMGAAVANELLSDYSGNLSGKTLGIVSADGVSEAVLNRRDGLIDGLKDSGVSVEWSMLGKDENGELLIKDKPKTDFIVALDNGGVKAAGRAADDNDIHGALLYGIGRSTEAVYYLDKGLAECLVVPDEFSVGYESLSETAKKLEQYFYKIENKTVTYIIMRRETLFSDANQKILFTMSQ